MKRALLGIAAAALAAAAGTTTWTSQAVPLPAGATHGSLKSVSCASAASCFGVGYYFISGTQLALAEHWNGSAWSVQATPRPAGATATALTGVSCASAASCTAVGNYFAGSQRSLAEHWNGSAWSVQVTPNPAGASFSELTGVSCASAASCTAAGDYEKGTARVPLAEQWNGSAWSVQAIPSPAGARMSFLYAVSCASAASCTAVGSTDSGALAEQWNGSAWSVQPVPAPAGGTLGLLAAVSCSSGSMCIATGDDVDGAGNAAPLAEQWNGSTWTPRGVPLPGGATAAVLSGVSCVSAASCTAVGQGDKGSAARALAEPRALAEHWNGSIWRVQATARPSVGQLLASVSCSSARACTAVGVAPKGEKGQPIAEQT